MANSTWRTYWDSIAVNDGDTSDEGRTMCLLKSWRVLEGDPYHCV